MQSLTKVTWARHTLIALDRKVFAPGEVSLVSLLVSQQGVEVVRQLLWVPAQCIDHRARRQESGQRSTRQQDRHRIQPEGIERFFGDVVGADVVLKGEIEFVVPGHKVKAGVFLHRVRVPQSPIFAASLGATGSIDVHPDPFCKPAYVPVPPAVRATVGDKPDNWGLVPVVADVPVLCSVTIEPVGPYWSTPPLFVSCLQMCYLSVLRHSITVRTEGEGPVEYSPQTRPIYGRVGAPKKKLLPLLP